MTKAQHRGLLQQIIDSQEKAIAALQQLLADLHNRSPIEPKKRTAPPTRLVRQKIFRLHRLGLSQQQVAHKLNISIGRVSETLRGKRR
jgi:DNA-binding NarL/FixJ family response regulator